MHFLATFWPENSFFGLFWRFFLHFHKFWPLPLATINFVTSNLFQMNSTAFLSQKLKKIWKKNFKLRGKPWIFEKVRIFFNFLIFYLKCFKMRGWTLFWDILVKSYGKKCAWPPNSAHCGATFSACVFYCKSSLIIQQYLSWLELASCQVEIMNNE